MVETRYRLRAIARIIKSADNDGITHTSDVQIVLPDEPYNKEYPLTVWSVAGGHSHGTQEWFDNETREPSSSEMILVNSVVSEYENSYSTQLVMCKEIRIHSRKWVKKTDCAYTSNRKYATLRIRLSIVPNTQLGKWFWAIHDVNRYSLIQWFGYAGTLKEAKRACVEWYKHEFGTEV